MPLLLPAAHHSRDHHHRTRRAAPPSLSPIHVLARPPAPASRRRSASAHPPGRAGAHPSARPLNMRATPPRAIPTHTTIGRHGPRQRPRHASRLHAEGDHPAGCRGGLVLAPASALSASPRRWFERHRLGTGRATPGRSSHRAGKPKGGDRHEPAHTSRRTPTHASAHPRAPARTHAPVRLTCACANARPPRVINFPRVQQNHSGTWPGPAPSSGKEREGGSDLQNRGKSVTGPRLTRRLFFCD